MSECETVQYREVECKHKLCVVAARFDSGL